MVFRYYRGICDQDTFNLLILKARYKTIPLTLCSSLSLADEIAERLSENYKSGKVDEAGQDLQLKLENIIQSTNSLDFSDFTKINNDKNNNDSHSAKLIDSKQEHTQEVSSELEDSGLKSDSNDSASVSSEQSNTVSSISADQSQGKSEQSASGELNDSANEPVRKQTSDSANTSDLTNDLSIISSSSSTNPSSGNSSFDSTSLSTSDYVSLNVKSLPTNDNVSSATAVAAFTDSPGSPSPLSKANATVLNSSLKQSNDKSCAPNDSTKTVKRDSEQNAKEPLPAVEKPTVKELPNKADSIKNAKQIKDDSFKKDRSSFFPSLPKSSSAETISKLKSNISSVSTNSSNLFNKTITTISNNLLTNITNKNRNRTADAKKQQATVAVNQPHQDTRKQEVDKQSDKQVNASSAAQTANSKQPVRAQTIDEERIMNEHAEDYGSLNCDHEPGLEFDDSELEQAAKLEDGKRVQTNFFLLHNFFSFSFFKKQLLMLSRGFSVALFCY